MNLLCKVISISMEMIYVQKVKSIKLEFRSNRNCFANYWNYDVSEGKYARIKKNLHVCFQINRANNSNHALNQTDWKKNTILLKFLQMTPKCALKVWREAINVLLPCFLFISRPRFFFVTPLFPGVRGLTLSTNLKVYCSSVSMHTW